MKLLVIEDDAETAAYVANGLKEYGHTVDLAATGRDALFLAAGEPYDLLIKDPVGGRGSRSMTMAWEFEPTNEIACAGTSIASTPVARHRAVGWG